MKVFRDIIDKINESSRIAILYHVNADGDAVGSALALQHAFFSENRIVDIFGEEEVQNNLKFLPGSDKIKIFDGKFENYDVAIALDAGGLNRLGGRIGVFESAENTINIDHHKSNNIEAEINYVEIDASASGEIIYKIIKEAGIKLTQEIATCLFAAITTDCGSFKFSNTSPDTHRIAAELMEAGADSSEISKKVFDNAPLSKLKLLGLVFDSIELHYDDKIAVLSVTNEMMNKTGAGVEESENVANYGISIEGVELAILLKEVDGERTRVSLRSKNYFDCSELGKAFGGGGHARAAGCDVNTSIGEAKELLLEKVKEFGI